jgi:hypothetical protein
LFEMLSVGGGTYSLYIVDIMRAMSVYRWRKISKLRLNPPLVLCRSSWLDDAALRQSGICCTTDEHIDFGWIMLHLNGGSVNFSLPPPTRKQRCNFDKET